MHVGFVGTGNMGSPMAANRLKAGHQLTVYDTARLWRLPTAWGSRGRRSRTCSLAAPCSAPRARASFILERKRAALAARDYRPGFFVDLALKDLRLALELAQEAGARGQVAREAWRLYGEASQEGFGALDSSGLLRLLEPLAAAAGLDERLVRDVDLMLPR